MSYYCPLGVIIFVFIGLVSIFLGFCIFLGIISGSGGSLLFIYSNNWLYESCRKGSIIVSLLKVVLIYRIGFRYVIISIQGE